MKVKRIVSFIGCGLMSVALLACGDAGTKSEEGPGGTLQFEEVQIEEKRDEGNSNEDSMFEESGIDSSSGEDLQAVESQPENVQGETEEEKSQASDNKTDGYGRMLFIGDSRTVDIFTGEKDKILGEKHDDISVYCMDGAQFKFMTDSIDSVGLDGFDTLVSWMGCNEFGDFSQYGPYYDELLGNGKQLVVCTVGPTKDECLLDDLDYLYYPNANQIAYNNSLKEWAGGAGVRVIDLYSFIDSTDTIYQDPQDGIHYFPKPNPELWNHILEELEKK